MDFAKLRSELLNADSTEAQLTRSSHEKIAADLAKLNSRLRDEIGRTQASVRLDLNLEKGRIREEANGQEMRIKETETRIEQEVAGLRERVEAVKFSTLQWLMYDLQINFFCQHTLTQLSLQGCLYRYRRFDSWCLASVYVKLLGKQPKHGFGVTFALHETWISHGFFSFVLYTYSLLVWPNNGLRQTHDCLVINGPIGHSTYSRLSV